MLVLYRKVGEKLLIGDDGIRIVVVGFRGKGVLLGIEAPREIKVVRCEIADKQKGGDAVDGVS